MFHSHQSLDPLFFMNLLFSCFIRFLFFFVNNTYFKYNICQSPIGYTYNAFKCPRLRYVSLSIIIQICTQ
ncbi:hypothetical protein CW304_13220 [Bacillus sp. UFRGS-B20]|nr:hypothetical protein CW304_13220 [Bacillus sp. UFRGS-B20]